MTMGPGRRPQPECSNQAVGPFTNDDVLGPKLFDSPRHEAKPVGEGRGCRSLPSTRSTLQGAQPVVGYIEDL